MFIINMTQAARALKNKVKPEKLFEKQQGNALTSFG